MWAFDLIELNGDDLRLDPLEMRKAMLATLLARAVPGIRLNEHMDEDGPLVFHHACKLGLEGIVSKRRDSAVRKVETFEPVTLRHVRGHGCRDLLIYCGSINCSHSATLNADHMPDDTPIRPLGARMVCSRCGYRGADARPDWSPHVNKRHV
jgi:hypothetical protein